MLKFYQKMMTDKYSRGTNYRSTFYKNHTGLFGSKKIYLCAYCGKPLTHRSLTVDHLIPIYKVQKKGFARFMMRVMGINNINDSKNLVPACKTCNSMKGTKMGLWLVRGMIGRHTFIWMIIYNLFIAGLIFIFRNYWPDFSNFVNTYFFSK